MHQIKQRVITAFGGLLLLAGSGLYAGSPETTDPTPQPLADAVDRIVQAMSYIDDSLLSDEYIATIEASGNYEAIAVLHRSLRDRELVEAQINQGRFDEAYTAMRAIENRMTAVIRRSWKEQQANPEENNLIAGI